jgi:hypothetical protein
LFNLEVKGAAMEDAAAATVAAVAAEAWAGLEEAGEVAEGAAVLAAQAAGGMVVVLVVTAGVGRAVGWEVVAVAAVSWGVGESAPVAMALEGRVLGVMEGAAQDWEVVLVVAIWEGWEVAVVVDGVAAVTTAEMVVAGSARAAAGSATAAAGSAMAAAGSVTVAAGLQRWPLRLGVSAVA